jgi:hypothetical protein
LLRFYPSASTRKGPCPDRFEVDAVLIQRGARAIALPPKSGAIYSATTAFEAPDPNSPRRRPSILPGSFVILAFGK